MVPCSFFLGLMFDVRYWDIVPNASLLKMFPQVAPDTAMQLHPLEQYCVLNYIYTTQNYQCILIVVACCLCVGFGGCMVAINVPLYEYHMAPSGYDNLVRSINWHLRHLRRQIMAGIKKHMRLVLLLSFSLVPKLEHIWIQYADIKKLNLLFFILAVEHVADFACIKMRYVESEVDDLWTIEVSWSK